MVHYIEAMQLMEMCGSEVSSANFASSLTEVLSVVLDAEVSCVILLGSVSPFFA